MTFATIYRIQTLRNYADAQRAYHLTKPLRGQKGSDIRPLGQRRDGHQYYIEQHLTENGTEFWAFLYNSPVVKFLPDNKIEVCTFGWGTGMTMAFISQVLDINAYRTRGNNVFVINDTKYVTKNHEKLLLGVDSISNRYYVIYEAEHQHYVINRTGANNVRRRTSEFRKYLKGFISLRTETVTERFNSYSPPVEVTRMTMALSEYDFVPRLDRKDWRENIYQILDIGDFKYLTHKQALHRFQFVNEQLNALTANDQPDDERTENFYRAALLLCITARGGELVVGGYNVQYDDVFYVDPKKVITLFDEAQFKFYSKEVFSLVPVPKGKVPRTDYDTWVDTAHLVAA